MSEPTAVVIIVILVAFAAVLAILELRKPTLPR